MKYKIYALIIGTVKCELEWASTSTFWDCYGGACGCGFENSDIPELYQYCNSGALFVAEKDNKYNAVFYGTATISDALGGTNWNS